MKMERDGFCYERVGFLSARITVALQPDGSISKEVGDLLQRSFRHNKEGDCLSVMLYTTEGGSMEHGVTENDRQNALVALKSVTADCLYTSLAISMSKAVITKKDLREEVFGNLDDDGIVGIYRSFPGSLLMPQPPRSRRLAYLWERARVETLVKNGGSSFDPAIDPSESLLKLIDQANQPKGQNF